MSASQIVNAFKDLTVAVVSTLGELERSTQRPQPEPSQPSNDRQPSDRGLTEVEATVLAHVNGTYAHDELFRSRDVAEALGLVTETGWQSVDRALWALHGVGRVRKYRDVTQFNAGSARVRYGRA